MKTSNKLLLGFFAAVVLCMIVGTLALKRAVGIGGATENRGGNVVTADSVQTDSSTITIDLR
ncbi:MAG TPA: hypothetical protein VK152_06895 [Paludibacter sp.]|nr:hypothetical protein [Paludibacter sp.]